MIPSAPSVEPPASSLSIAARIFALSEIFVATGQKIPASEAYYDEGGDVQYCTHGESSVQRTPEGASVRGYDRCLPTLVAFKERAQAEAYQKIHGGRVLTYAEAVESARAQ